MPQKVQPMLARTGKLPPGDELGVRDQVGRRARDRLRGGRTAALESRNGNNITPRYPELRALGRALGTHEAILDGEVVALDSNGRPSFQRLQRRMHLTSEGMVRRLSQSEPVVYMIFDLLWLDGHSLMELTYDERRASGWPSSSWQARPGRRPRTTSATARRCWRPPRRRASRAWSPSGVTAHTCPGRRTQGWVKVKNVRNTDVVVGGWVGGDGGRLGKIGALVIGFTTDDGELRYAGKVGTGFTDAELKRLQGIVDPLARETTPFTGAQPEKATHFIEPTLVASVDYGDVTDAGTLRHPVYKGLRDDLDPADAWPRKNRKLRARPPGPSEWGDGAINVEWSDLLRARQRPHQALLRGVQENGAVPPAQRGDRQPDRAEARGLGDG